MQERSSAVAARRLGHSWPNGARALEAISLDIAVGEKVALLGPNGAGKSTFLRLLAGRLRPTEGELAIFGQRDPSQQGCRVAYLPQEITLDPEMKAGETLNLIAALLGLPEKKKRVAEAADRFGLGSQLGKFVAELSGGWRRRLDLALFFLDPRELLLLDEPAAGLDAAAEELLFAELKRRSAEGATIVFAGHDRERLGRFTKRALLFGEGRIVAEGAPEALLPAGPATPPLVQAGEGFRPGSGSGAGPGGGRGQGRGEGGGRR